MKFTMKVEKEVTASQVHLHAKIRDEGNYRLIADDGTLLKDHDGYVPGFFPGQHYGDYLDLQIDLETGRIVNWKTPSAEDLRAFVSPEEE